MGREKQEKVEWRMKGIFKGDATKCHAEVMSLEKITPETVVQYAENPESELHKCFEWSNEIAAKKWRLHTARNLIGSFVLIKKEPEEQPKRVFQISSDTNVYQPVTFFMRNESEYELLLSRAKAELNAIKNRYQQIVELENVFTAIEEL